MSKLLFILFWFALSISSVFAAGKKEAPYRPVLKAGQEITVGAYDAETDTFEYVFNKEPAVGPNNVTPEALQKAIGLPGSKTDFIRKMQSENGPIYVLKKDLPSLLLTELEARKKKSK